MKRTITISIHRDPPISGYGGFDEWTIGPLESEQVDALMSKIDKVVKDYSRKFLVEGKWTGSN